MTERQFLAILNLLIQIEQNTRGVDVLNKPIKSEESQIDQKALKFQDIFFKSLEILDEKTALSLHNVKQIFIDSREELKKPLDRYPF